MGSEPDEGIPLPVNQGLFALGLGDTNLPGMTDPVPAALFRDNPAVRLRTWFSASGAAGTFERLSPDQPLHSVGFALAAATAQSAETATTAATAGTACSQL